MDAPRLIDLDDVVEGMVLSSSVFDEDDKLLYPTGYPISLEVLLLLKKHHVHQVSVTPPVIAGPCPAPANQVSLSDRLAKLDLLFSSSEQVPLNTQLKQHIAQFWTKRTS